MNSLQLLQTLLISNVLEIFKMNLLLLFSSHVIQNISHEVTPTFANTFDFNSFRNFQNEFTFTFHEIVHTNFRKFFHISHEVTPTFTNTFDFNYFRNFQNEFTSTFHEIVSTNF